MSLKRVLICNRGEIAIRIARAATSLGMESVAVFAAADRLALHTRYATKAVELPGSDPVAAYLDIEAMIAIARAERCDCIHPGYGFLSENAGLAKRCGDENITFVGPSAEALMLFGDKVRSRELAQSQDIPVVTGSLGALDSVEQAGFVAAELGYPVMLKASAGGGGRGMRLVASAADMAEAYGRCQSEAKAAFGDGDVFLEKVIQRPRHIEVQVLADSSGTVLHLHERDCSVQLRNQKVVEVAPADHLDPDLKHKLTSDAVRLLHHAAYENAGTVEFLVVPETGEYYFIECNPRIQVEHTVTEMVTGLDLVELQFQIAGGKRLEELGLANQKAVGLPLGFAVQARVVAQGPGTITGYREPAGPGVRVDSAGYAGLTPPPQYDPLLGKVIGVGRSLEAAVLRTRRALAEFQITGLPTNLGQLLAMLNHVDVISGDARTTLLVEAPELMSSGRAASDAVAFLDAQAPGREGQTKVPDPVPESRPSLAVGEGERGIECPTGGQLVELAVRQGDTVGTGDTIMVVSAMKMETVVSAPCSGTIAEVQPLIPGELLVAGQVVVVMTPAEAGTGIEHEASRDSTWVAMMEDVATLREMGEARLGPASDEPGVVRQRDRGKLTCRERIDMLLDNGSFREVGSVAGFASYDDQGRIAAFTPANSVGGWGEIEGRTAVVCADDFTSRGGHADGAIGAKSGYLDRLSMELRIPSIRMLDGSSGGGSVAAMVPAQKKEGDSKAKESSGAISAGRPRVAGGGGSFLPGHLGSNMYAEQLTTVPVVNMLLGSVVGIGAAKAVLGHFSVMVRDIAQLFVAGPPVVSHAMGYDITKEDLGDWRIHCTNGSVDNLADSEQEAARMARRFLSYLPSSVYEAPPVIAPDASDPADRREEELFYIIPRKRTTTFDVRRVIELLADRGSFFEIGALWGTDQVTGFVRMNGHPVGVIASDSRHVNGGALTADGCDKLKRHLDLCDLFHIPVLNLVDNPGFAVGVEHERAGTIRKGGEWMVAFAQVNIPIFTVIMRRSFGVAGNNYATPRSRPSVRVAWPASDVGGIPPEGGIEAAYKRQLAESEDPEALRAELYARIESARGPVGPLNRFQIEEMVDPRDTRRLVCEWVPQAYRVISHPAGLVPRPLAFRP